jgi:diguanylate cyclase (GGDEF)-like protein
LRLDAYVRAKQEVDRAREESLLDELTGLYNIRGLARRARELGSQSFRQKEPFACIALTMVMNDASELDELSESEVVSRLAGVLRETGRTSDAIGMLGPGVFAVVAQGTDPAGAVRLAERMATAASETLSSRAMSVVAGYDAVPNYHDAPIEPSDMLMRASMAMRLSRSEPLTTGMLNIRRFEGQLS